MSFDPLPMDPECRYLLGMRVDATSYKDASARITRWAIEGDARYVCAANVHMTMESYDSEGFRSAVNKADLVTPDGMPLVWALRALGIAGQRRVYGPSLMLSVCEKAEAEGLGVGLYGGDREVLRRLKFSLRERFPRLRLCYACSPPFRELSRDEELRIGEEIRGSGAQIVFVALGCPRQELWMHRRSRELPAVLVGVGAAFDFLSGTVRQAPDWMQRVGLEWLYRLASDPRRLWRRYLLNNPRFLVLIARQILAARISRH